MAVLLVAGILLLLAAQATNDHLTVWTESSMVRVTNASRGGGAAATSASIALAGNEHESWQVVLRRANNTDDCISAYSVDVSDLEYDDGRHVHRIGAGAVRWGQVGFVYVDNLTAPASMHQPPVPGCSGFGPDSSGCSGYWPDPILPVDLVTVLPNFTLPLWFTLLAPAGSAAGVYGGTVTLRAAEPPAAHAGGLPPCALRKEEEHVVPVQAKVYNFSLPPVFAFKTAAQLSLDTLVRSRSRATSTFSFFYLLTHSSSTCCKPPGTWASAGRFWR